MSRFGVVPPEPLRQHDTALLAPKFQKAVDGVLADMEAGGFDPIVYETLRTPERQHWLAGFGRDYDDGRGQVTKALDVFTTWHGYGLAVDIISKSKEWDVPQSFWTALGAHAAFHGLAWGGTWHTNDLPHVQPDNLHDSPTDRARQLYADGGLPAVWAAVGAL